ncbi:hypothetical protein Pyn_37440 [Prunus yedoensis var. nudiflora]|uniref:Uncharacterized protein n=1 Tax=Prunus yedoensis var. nudiflora TaxID=2094558 RepID=A0A315A3C8_PRUYE|nr:hypothetical protein Pyn_37440 [Prunus yedoensis var. nudiflora]
MEEHGLKLKLPAMSKDVARSRWVETMELVEERMGKGAGPKGDLLPLAHGFAWFLRWFGFDMPVNLPWFHQAVGSSLFALICFGFDKVLDILTDVGYFQVL